jgi:NADH-quinone oxidoreductase subunit N
MSAPVLWILVPIGIGASLILLRRFNRLVWLTGTIVISLLALMVWLIGIGRPVVVGPLSFTLQGTFQVLGRQFILLDQERQLLGLVFAFAAVWIAVSPLVHPGNLFIPIAMAICGLLTAALTVVPFLYAALFIEIAILLSVPLLVPPGGSPGKGVLRFLTYETLGMPFILFSDWMLAGSEGSPADFDLVLRAAILLAIGFAFLLAVFPFHSWIPMLFEESHPYIAAFVAILLFIVVTFLGIELFNRFVWLRNSAFPFLALRFAGLLMVGVGGIWAAFENHLGRIMGFAIMIVTGLSMLSISLGLDPGLDYYVSLITPAVLALLVLSVALPMLSETRASLNLNDFRGIGWEKPLLAVAVFLAFLTLAGFPLLAGYPVYTHILGGLALDGTFVAFGGLAGALGLFVAGIRTLWTFMADTGPRGEAEFEDRDAGPSPVPLGQRIFFLVGIILMIVIGML